MKELFIVANWKAHKTISEAKVWLEEMTTYKDQLEKIENKTIVVCVPTTLLSFMKQYIDEHLLPIKLGAEDISIFDEGAYTGEITGTQIREFAEYVIIGHSERRDNFGEDYEILKKKVIQAQKYGLQPIFCVQSENTPIPTEVSFIAFEPVSAIGTGNPDTPEHAEEVSKVFRSGESVYYVLYGGSVNPSNTKLFSEQPHISGFLVGGGSLKADEFFKIITNA